MGKETLGVGISYTVGFPQLIVCCGVLVQLMLFQQFNCLFNIEAKPSIGILWRV